MVLGLQRKQNLAPSAGKAAMHPDPQRSQRPLSLPAGYLQYYGLARDHAGSADRAVQRKCTTPGCTADSAPQNESTPQEVAARGMTGATQALPYAERIQTSFGRHRVAGIEAHVGGPAAESAQELGANAYAMGTKVAFAASPDLHTAAHEAAHVIQQQSGLQLKNGVGQAGDAHEQHADAVADLVVQGQSAEKLLDQYASAGPTTCAGCGAQKEAAQGEASECAACQAKSQTAGAAVQKNAAVVQLQAGGGGSGGCPESFCKPFSLPKIVVEQMRTTAAPALLAGIAIKVNPRVVPLWSQYLFGGAAPQDLSAQFGADFTSSATTAATTDFLVDELKKDLTTKPPAFPPGDAVVTIDIPSRIGAALTEIDTPESANEMNFNVIGEVPGNIAGGIGKTQTTTAVGARPSPFNDSRTATGTALVTRLPDGSLSVIPTINFTVKDTIDLCPGNCGAPTEQRATVPLSRFEASGVSGDVPFTVNFPAPPRVFTVTPAPTPVPPTPTPAGPVTGIIKASALRIRSGPSTAAKVLGSYPRGTNITILCQTQGTEVEGNAKWDKTNKGFVSDRFVERTAEPPAC